MATNKAKVQSEGAPSKLELERLIEAQRADADGKERKRPRHVEYEDARATTEPASTRLSGAELREHVRWYATRELKRAGLKLPDGLAGAVTRARARHAIDARAAELHTQLHVTLAAARALVANTKLQAGGLALQDLAESVEGLTPWWAAEYERRPWLPTALTSDVVTVQGFSLARQAPTPRAVLVRALGAQPWNDLRRAYASLVIGNWPTKEIGEAEEVAPEEVIKLERAAVRKARQRRA